MVANKVSRVVNCAGRQIPNHWSPIGIVYLTFNWNDHESQVSLCFLYASSCAQSLFDPKDQNAD